MVFLCIASIVLSSIALHGIALHRIAWHCMVLQRYHALGPLNGPLRHSWGPQKGSFRARMALLGAPGDQIWSQRPPIGPSGLNSYSPHTLTWYQAPSGPLGVPKGPVFARNAPFGALGVPRRALGVQIWSQLPPIGPPGLDIWSPHTLTWYRVCLLYTSPSPRD